MRFSPILPVFFLAAQLIVPVSARAEELAVVRADLGYASQYVVRGVARTGAAAQSALELDWTGFRAGLWTNQPFKAGEEREVDFNTTFAWQAGAGLKMEVSARQYWFDRTTNGGTTRSFEAAIAATLAPVGGVLPRLEFAHDFRLRAETLQMAVGHSVALTGVGTYLDLGCFAGWATGDNWRPGFPGPGRHDSYSFWGLEATIPYNLGYVVPHSTVIAGLHYSDAIGRSAANGPFGLAKTRNFWVTLGVSLDF